MCSCKNTHGNNSEKIKARNTILKVIQHRYFNRHLSCFNLFILPQPQNCRSFLSTGNPAQIFFFAVSYKGQPKCSTGKKTWNWRITAHRRRHCHNAFFFPFARFWQWQLNKWKNLIYLVVQTFLYSLDWVLWDKSNLWFCELLTERPNTVCVEEQWPTKQMLGNISSPGTTPPPPLHRK